MRALIRRMASETMVIAEVRRPEASELDRFADWAKPLMLFGIAGSGRQLKHFTWRDQAATLNGRHSDGMTPGSDNAAWILTGAEYAATMAIETERAAVANATKQKAQDEANTKLNAAIAEARATDRPVEIDKYVTEDCTTHEPDCSFDCCSVVVDATGKITREYSHCF